MWLEVKQFVGWHISKLGKLLGHWEELIEVTPCWLAWALTGKLKELWLGLLLQTMRDDRQHKLEEFKPVVGALMASIRPFKKLMQSN